MVLSFGTEGIFHALCVMSMIPQKSGKKYTLYHGAGSKKNQESASHFCVNERTLNSVRSFLCEGVVDHKLSHYQSRLRNSFVYHLYQTTMVRIIWLNPDLFPILLVLSSTLWLSTEKVNGLSTTGGRLPPSHSSTATTCARQLDELQNCTESILRQDDQQTVYSQPTSPGEAYLLCRNEIQDTTNCAQSLLDVAAADMKAGSHEEDDDGRSSLSSLSSLNGVVQASLLACLPWKFNWEFCLNYEGEACSSECNESNSDDDDDDSKQKLSPSSSSDASTNSIVTRRGAFLPDSSCNAFDRTLRHGMLCCQPCLHYMEAYEGCVLSYKTCGDHNDDDGGGNSQPPGVWSWILSFLTSSSTTTNYTDSLIARNRRYIALILLILASPMVILSFLRQVCALVYWRCCRQR
jgi:hypothetical protein